MNNKTLLYHTCTRPRQSKHSYNHAYSQARIYMSSGYNHTSNMAINIHNNQCKVCWDWSTQRKITKKKPFPIPPRICWRPLNRVVKKITFLGACFFLSFSVSRSQQWCETPSIGIHTNGFPHERVLAPLRSILGFPSSLSISLLGYWWFRFCVYHVWKMSSDHLFIDIQSLSFWISKYIFYVFRISNLIRNLKSEILNKMVFI